MGGLLKRQDSSRSHKQHQGKAKTPEDGDFPKGKPCGIPYLPFVTARAIPKPGRRTDTAHRRDHEW